jgi:type I restriction-modification system DNA methylase subunit
MKERFFAQLEELVALAQDFPRSAFAEAAPEEVTKHRLLLPLLHALGYEQEQIVPEYRIIGDQVDYLLRTERPLLFVEAKSLIDAAPSLFEAHCQQVLRYIRNYRVSPQQAEMERPVNWILLTNFAQFQFIRVNEEQPSFSFTLGELLRRREELWELLAPENLEADRIEELYEQQQKAPLDQRFLADLKRWRLLLANGFALRNQSRSLADLKLASQQLLDRFLFCRMLETYGLLEHNKLARAFAHYEALYGETEQEKTFAEVLKESLFGEIKRDFNTELFVQPLLCDELRIDNLFVATVVGHEPLHSEIAAQCGLETGPAQSRPFKHLYGYDFSRMSRDIIGAVYERFLAHELRALEGRIVIEDTDELRKKEGAYYTPQYVVDYIVEQTLGEKIGPVVAEACSLLGYGNYRAACAGIRQLRHLKVLDPAMGSGSFLLRAFDALVNAYGRYNEACRRLKADRRNGSGLLFDASSEMPEEITDPALHVLTENLFGVDLDAQAVEMAKLNLWLRYMALNREVFRERLRSRPRRGKPLNLLPALTANLKQGHSLISDPAVAGGSAFAWEKEFSDVLKRGGFDVVVGNPPYRMLQPHNTGEDVLGYLRRHFVKAEFKIDLFHLFLQRGVSLVKPGGFVGYILPTSILNNVFAATLRRWLLDQCCLDRLAVCSEQVFGDADVHTTILILRREESLDRRATHEVLTTPRFSKRAALEDIPYSRTRQSRFSDSPGCVWNILLNEHNAGLIERLQQGFQPLKSLARINRGLATGDRTRFVSERKLTPSHVPIIEGADVSRYYVAPATHFVLFERPDTAGGCWEPQVHLAPHKIVIRQIGQGPTASLVREPLAVTANLFTVRAASLDEELCLLGILNSRLTDFFWRTMFADFKTSFPQVTVFSLEQLPIKGSTGDDAAASVLKARLIAGVSRMLDLQRQLREVPSALARQIRRLDRAPCNLAHYLQRDFAAVVKHTILVEDVRQAGFLHRVEAVPEGETLALLAAVAQTAESEPRPVPILSLEFKDPALRQFVHTCWGQFLQQHARQKRWTKGKRPEPIYPLVVNLLEPLLRFSGNAGDDLRLIREVMGAVAREAGSSDLAAVQGEIAELNGRIDRCVYELYGLAPDERAIIEGKSA